MKFYNFLLLLSFIAVFFVPSADAQGPTKEEAEAMIADFKAFIEQFKLDNPNDLDALATLEGILTELVTYSKVHFTTTTAIPTTTPTSISTTTTTTTTPTTTTPTTTTTTPTTTTPTTTTTTPTTTTPTTTTTTPTTTTPTTTTTTPTTTTTTPTTTTPTTTTTTPTTTTPTTTTTTPTTTTPASLTCPACQTHIGIIDSVILLLSHNPNPGANGTCPTGIYRFFTRLFGKLGKRCCCRYPKNYQH